MIFFQNVNLVKKQSCINKNIYLLGFTNEESMIEYYNNHSTIVLSGIIFESEQDNSTQTGNLRYKVSTEELL